MRVLFIGYGAVSAVGAHLLGGVHDVAIATRSAARLAEPPLPARRRARGPKTGIRQLRLVTHGQSESGVWDLVVVTPRPSDVDAGYLGHLAKGSPQAVFATTSQVPGDLERLAGRVGSASVIMLAPQFLAFRRADGARPIEYWAPPGSPVFAAAGEASGIAVARSVAAQAKMRLQVRSVRDLLESAARTMPFTAELTIRSGVWADLVGHVHRPRAAALEASAVIRGKRTSLPPAWLIRLALTLLPHVVPLNIKDYASEHFRRHEQQTLQMLNAWADGARPGQPVASLRSLAHALDSTARSTVRRSADER